jgi:Arc/MetJ-type ribon-helix-helix transcriptional regulator
MDITLTPEQQSFIQRAVASGHVRSAEEAVTEALLLWEEQDLRRSAFIGSLDRARASIARGEGRVITPDSMRALATDAKRRLRERLASEAAAA